jgi:hypothetical protein
MKKGRHRRFEEARLLKRSTEVVVEPCAECGAGPEEDHASWCLATEDVDDDTLGDDDLTVGPDQVPGPDQGPGGGNGIDDRPDGR